MKRIKAKKGVYLVERAGTWYLETCRNGFQKRLSIDTVITRTAGRRITTSSAITFTPTKQVHAFLRQLLSTGLYGFTVEDVVDRIVCEKLIETLNPQLAQKK